MRGVAIATGAALSLALLGCGGDETTTTGASGATGATGAGEVSNTVKVSETEYAMTPEGGKSEEGGPPTTTAKPGAVTFQITNDGEETHSFVFNNVGKEIPLGGGSGEELEPGESAELTVKGLSAGFYEYYCPIDNHQAMGMQGQLEVK